MKKYTLTIPDLTMEEARKIADAAYGSMMWGPSDDGKSLAAYPTSKPVLITPDDDAESPENVKVMAHPLAGANVDRGVRVEIRWKHRKQRG
jgi:hypothetical protein